jgi:hypothetical protein
MMCLSKLSLDYLNLFLEGELDSSGSETINTYFDITPSKFLKYAEYDLAAKYDHYLVNSLSNTKRAIDCQLDSLLIAFGLSERAKRWRFPEKINYLNSIGIISPRILNKINKKRNLLEHEYKNPNEEEVEDALDVALLFVNYTSKYILRAVTEYDLYCETEEVVNFLTATLDWRNCKLVFVTSDNNEKQEETTEISSSRKEYDDYLKVYLKLCNYHFYGMDSED